jgi:hypothetical protein
MKKTGSILLFVTLAMASCRDETPKDEWTDGSDDPQRRDTVVNNTHYRHYHGSYFPLINGMISPRSYQGSTIHDISRPGFTPSRVSRGGFGGFSRSSGG